MIIQLESATAEDIQAARRELEAVANSWGHEMAEAPATTPETAGAAGNDDKQIDPVSVTAEARPN